VENTRINDEVKFEKGGISYRPACRTEVSPVLHLIVARRPTNREISTETMSTMSRSSFFNVCQTCERFCIIEMKNSDGEIYTAPRLGVLRGSTCPKFELPSRSQVGLNGVANRC
jgi:hypothetical protein